MVGQEIQWNVNVESRCPWMSMKLQIFLRLHYKKFYHKSLRTAITLNVPQK